MTVREELHNMIDTLPEEQIADVLEYIEDLRELPPETASAIQEGLADVQEGRSMSLEEYRRSRGL